MYFARVYNGADYSDSLTATIIVVGPPEITQQPTSQVIAQGETATFSVGATGTSVGYQWFRGTPGTGAYVGSNSPVFTTHPLSNNTPYWVRLTNLLGRAYYCTSAVAYATVATSLAPSASNYVTVVGGTFANPISATLRDSAGNRMADQPVTFAAPNSGASGFFAVNLLPTEAATTSSNGLATAGNFTANSTAGPFDLVVNFRTLTSSIPMLNLPANPQLGITSGASGMALFWPALATGYTLQSTTNLSAGTNWTDIAGSVQTNLIALPPTNGRATEFYRLKFNPASF